jgi:hypothetical protein
MNNGFEAFLPQFPGRALNEIMKMPEFGRDLVPGHFCSKFDDPFT